MGPQEDFIETVVTCEGDFHDPQLHSRLEQFRRGLKDLLLTDMHKLILKKVEPWNSVRVTFNIPKEAALRLKQLAQQGNAALRELGVLAVQIQGDQVVSLTIAGRNNERAELIITTDTRAGNPSVSVFDSGMQSSDEQNSPGASNVEVTRKNIAEYLRQGTSLFDSLFSQSQPGVGNGVFKSPNVVATSCDPIPFRPNNVINTSSGSTSPSVTQAPLFMSCFPPGRSPTGYPASPSANYPSPGPSRSPIGQPGLKFPSPPGIPPGIPQPATAAGTTTATPAPAATASLGNLNHVGLPPPPPYPLGSATINNIQRPGKTVSVSSPLLVNLLQTEPMVAGFNNLPGNKMLPPQEGGPPPKKRRRPRKPKDKETTSKPTALPAEGEISIKSVLNPVLDAAGMISSDRVESPVDSPHSGYALEPNVSLSPSQRVTPPAVAPLMGNIPQLHNPGLKDGVSRGSYPEGSERDFPSVESFSMMSDSIMTKFANERGRVPEESDPFPPEMTAGKIINPYTGQLEPIVDSSDRSPHKMVGGGRSKTPKVKHTTKANRGAGNVQNVFLSRGKRHLGKNSATVTKSEQTHVDGNLTPSQKGVSVSDMFIRSEVRTKESNFKSQQSHVEALTSASHQGSVPVSGGSLGVSTVASQIYASSYHTSHHANTAVSLGASLPHSTAHTSLPATQAHASASLIGMFDLSSGKSITKLSSSPFSSSPPSLQPGSVMHPLLEPNSGKPHPKPSQYSMPSHTPELHNSSGRSQYPVDSMLRGSTNHTSPRDNAPAFTQGAQHSAKTDSVTLLNSPTARSIDSNCITQSPESKMPSEGDESSNHSGIIPDITAENTSAGSFLDSGSSKVYNHDSGVGSSSERSDDTPSEPGDSEYRSTHVSAESEECSKSQKLLECKSDSKIITVGCVMDSEHKDRNELTHLPTLGKEQLPPSIGHVKNMTNFTDIHSNNQVTVLHWSTKDTKTLSSAKGLTKSEHLTNSHMGKLKNGPTVASRNIQKDTETEVLQSFSPVQQNALFHSTMHPGFSADVASQGPVMNANTNCSQGSGVLSEASHPNLGHGSDLGNTQDHQLQNAGSPASSGKQGSPLPIGSDNLQCNTSSSDWLNLPQSALSSTCDMDPSDFQELSQSNCSSQHGRPENRSPGLSVCMVGGEARYQVSSPKCGVDKIYPGAVDSEGQIGSRGGMGKGQGPAPDGLKRSNITSMYSKRSSPVNVNMLNHIYAPGLPAPRRLTESVQRLVKPLPSSDNSLPQMRSCKSPGASSSKQGPNGDKSPRSGHGGARSPGANTLRNASGEGKPHSQVPHIQQNALSGGVVSVNYNPAVSVSNPPSSHSSFVSGQSRSQNCGSGNPQSHPADADSGYISSQHSIPVATVTGASDHPNIDYASESMSPSSHVQPSQQSFSSSSPLSEPGISETASESVPSLSHKCNTAREPSSESEQSVLYARDLSLSADKQNQNSVETCAMDHSVSPTDLNLSTSSHNTCTESTDTVSSEVNTSINSSVTCLPQLTEGEMTLNQTVLGNDTGPLSQHSTDGLAGSVATSGKETISNAPRQHINSDKTLSPDPSQSQSDHMDVPNLPSIDDSVEMLKKEITDSSLVSSTEPSCIGQSSNSQTSAEDSAVVSSELGSVENVSTDGNKIENLGEIDLCSSRAASNTNDSPTSRVERVTISDSDHKEIQGGGKTLAVVPDPQVDGGIDNSVQRAQLSDTNECAKSEKQPDSVQEEPSEGKSAIDKPEEKELPSGEQTPPRSFEGQTLSESGTAESITGKTVIPDNVPTKTDHTSTLETVESKLSNNSAHETELETATKNQSNTQAPEISTAEQDSIPMRRITRKRKSTHSESDGRESEHDTGLSKLGSSTGDLAKNEHKPEAPCKTTTPEQGQNIVSENKTDSIGMGLRTRETRRQSYVEEKAKNCMEEGNEKVITERNIADKKMDSMLKEDDLTTRRGHLGRRNRTLPALPSEKPQPYSFFDTPIIPGRTRSQSAPSTENKEQKEESPESLKRSTRSLRPKDAPEQPLAKRRRSRDHR